MKITRIAASAALALTVVGYPIAAYATFAPATRQTYTCEAAKADGSVPCPGADHVVFNSFTNNPVVGDERPFVAGSINGQNVQDRIQVKDGDIISVRMYVHNNADPNKIGDAAATANNVIVKVLVPTATQNDSNIVGFISATNASPVSVSDTMSVFNNDKFTLNYVAGSAVFQHSPTGVAGSQQYDTVSDTIVTPAGANLGSLKGCFQYSGYVTLKVKVNMPAAPVTPPVTPVKPVTPVTPPAPVTPAAPAKPVAAPVTPAVVATPTALVNTGPGEVAALFAVATIGGSIGYRMFLGRRFSN